MMWGRLGYIYVMSGCVLWFERVQMTPNKQKSFCVDSELIRTIHTPSVYNIVYRNVQKFYPNTRDFRDRKQFGI